MCLVDGTLEGRCDGSRPTVNQSSPSDFRTADTSGNCGACLRRCVIVGHATDDDIASGRSDEFCRRGNDIADAMADRGTQQHGSEVVAYSEFIDQNFFIYASCLHHIHNKILRILEAESTLRTTIAARTPLQNQLHGSTPSDDPQPISALPHRATVQDGRTLQLMGSTAHSHK